MVPVEMGGGGGGITPSFSMHILMLMVSLTVSGMKNTLQLRPEILSVSVF